MTKQLSQSSSIGALKTKTALKKRRINRENLMTIFLENNIVISFKTGSAPTCLTTATTAVPIPAKL